MPQFNIGDRVRFIRDNPFAGRGFGHQGDLATIVRVYPAGQESVKLKLDVDRGYGNYEPEAPCDALELVVDAPPQKIDKVYYSLVYKPRYGSQRMMGFSTEREATEKKAQIEAAGGKVFGMKKLTLKLDAQEGL